MTKIQELIQKKERKYFPFQPSKSFYHDVKISQKRWGMLFRGDISPTIDELNLIAGYFEIPITDLI